MGEYIQAVGIIAGLYAAFLFHGLAQEHLFVTAAPGKFDHGNFLVASTAGFNCLQAAFSITQSGDFRKTVKKLYRDGVHRDFAVCAASSSASMIASLQALRFVSYPAQQLLKSAKSVPVVIGNYCIYGKVYPWYDRLSVMVVTLSLVVFNTVKSSSSHESSSPVGIALCCLSLCLDGFTGPYQDAAIKRHKTLTSNELMLCQNFFTAIISFIIWIVMDGPTGIFTFFNTRPSAILPFFAVIFCGSIGQSFIYKALVAFGALPLSLITTLRKFLTVLLSVLSYGHRLLPTQWCCVAAIFGALTIQVILKNRTRTKEKAN